MKLNSLVVENVITLKNIDNLKLKKIIQDSISAIMIFLSKLLTVSRKLKYLTFLLSWHRLVKIEPLPFSTISAWRS